MLVNGTQHMQANNKANSIYIYSKCFIWLWHLCIISDKYRCSIFNHKKV